MIQGTTPTITLTLSGCDLSMFTKIHVAFKQKSIMIEKTSKTITVEGNQLKVPLTQEDTLAFDAGYPVMIQVRMVDSNGVAVASEIKSVPVDKVLKDGVI